MGELAAVPVPTTVVGLVVSAGWAGRAQVALGLGGSAASWLPDSGLDLPLQEPSAAPSRPTATKTGVRIIARISLDPSGAVAGCGAAAGSGAADSCARTPGRVIRERRAGVHT